MDAYSFLDVNCTLVGPGGMISLGAGNSVDKEGIDISPSGAKNTMMIGADGEGIHSLHGDKSGQITIRLLKNSPQNKLLMAMYGFQTTGASTHGQNTVVVNDSARGDFITASQVAFNKVPDLRYGDEATSVEWVFDAVKIDRGLGA